MNELEEAEISMFRAWIKEKKEQQQGKPWPRWMFSKDMEGRRMNSQQDARDYFLKKRKEILEELKRNHNCKEHSNCVKCTGDIDVYECQICGNIWKGPCNFDEDFA